ncbi:Helix-turn-helix domain-containing protein [Streptoalloteichus tenebrarius]|uniref:Helix-turn-helix domain-containing protein n=1 Tax=Streptoalloteichus tenebrarius (strain ATCC 17920 / DSM 40477 / JCM 4838 / CBS 697.72 / NBRC 16177 / NCIMB 11028 / NRRL B-12390 / A12253. 1 / ISP 5477) TaxID=1933 RepID=A0ABT1HP17_STRSD|nr:helix-turn-helix transcriptional regulator [Streptoalloteichus tenebrarius]MCP2257251.1 Helix-turn-helix domain-containing protein [Streptoalloteichus tenebrarius]BFF04158.1 helix-turn-helix transcriptional regulator [Streptoalloteichus tenebrarius]
MTKSWMRISPPLIKRYIALQLVRFRKNVGASQEEVQAATGVSRANLAQLETARHLPKPQITERLLTFYGVPEKIRDFCQLVEAAKVTDPWTHIESNIKDFDLFLGLEQSATTIESFDAVAVPGLLQTPEYARAVLAASAPALSIEEIEGFVQQRMERQAVFKRSNPPSVWAIVTEGALRCVVGGPQVMADQLDHLMAIARQPGIQLQVTPANAGAHASMQGSFSVFGFTTTLIGIGYLESVVRGTFVDEPEEVERLVAVMNALRITSLSPAESMVFIERVRKEVTT